MSCLEVLVLMVVLILKFSKLQAKFLSKQIRAKLNQIHHFYLISLKTLLMLMRRNYNKKHSLTNKVNWMLFKEVVLLLSFFPNSQIQNTTEFISNGSKRMRKGKLERTLNVKIESLSNWKYLEEKTQFLFINFKENTKERPVMRN